MQSQMRKANLFHHRQTKEIQMASNREHTKPLNIASSAIWAHVSYSSLMVTNHEAEPPPSLHFLCCYHLLPLLEYVRQCLWTRKRNPMRHRDAWIQTNIYKCVCVCVFPLRIALFVLWTPHTELVKALHAVAYFGARLSNMAAEAALLKSARKL